MLKQKIPSRVGVVGAGSFGSAIAMLLSYNVDVLLYARNAEKVEQINEQKEHLGINFNDRVIATNDMEELGRECRLIFPVVPSVNFREMMQQLGPYLRPNHILIHGTKGFDTRQPVTLTPEPLQIQHGQVSTMSEVIREESAVLRIGCLAGPNLAREIIEGQPTATVVASNFNEVITLAQSVLRSDHFHVFGANDLLGAELAGALKNIIAIGSGILRGKGFGTNLQAILINRGLIEMIYFGRGMGASPKAFLGTAGIGDLVATSTSSDSRNFTFGYRIAQGEKINEIIDSMPEVAEGVRTLKIVYNLARNRKVRIPIMEMLYRVVFEDLEIDRALQFLMNYPYEVDVDFI